MVRASIIVVSWNGRTYLEACLSAVLAQIGTEDEVIVIDNASTDGSAALVREHYPQVRLVENEHNLGFAGGLDVGLRAAQGDFLVSVNQDVVVHQGWLESLLEALTAPEVGIVGCKLLYPDGTIQHAGGMIHWPQAFVDHYGYRQVDDGQWDEPRSVDYVTGAAWGFRRSVLEQVGFLDEGYWPGYYEEVDYCFRARQVGWQVVYVPGASGIHHESTSLEHGSIAYHEAFHRGRLRFVFNNYWLEQVRTGFFSSEQQYMLEVPAAFARRVLARAYFSVMLSVPDLLDGACVPTALLAEAKGLPVLLGEIITNLSDLYLLALHPSQKGEGQVDDQPWLAWLPTLQEHNFESNVPVLGPLIQMVRRGLYGLTAKWGVWAVINQQNQVNRLIAQRLQEYEARLIDQDRDLAHLARTVAEVEIRQRYLAKRGSSQTGQANQNGISPDAPDSDSCV